jgi:hypothetical protein
LNGVMLDPETPCSAISIGGVAGYIWQSVFRPKPGPTHRPIPFVTVIQKQRSLIKRGVPYLRHSWSRIDFIAIVGFWIAFTLSVTGVDRTVSVNPATKTAILVRHIGVFRVLSVLRCARLVAVTNGTTVSHWHALEKDPTY